MTFFVLTNKISCSHFYSGKWYLWKLESVFSGLGHSYLVPEQKYLFSLCGDGCVYLGSYLEVQTCTRARTHTYPGHQQHLVSLSENTYNGGEWRPENTGPHRLSLEVERYYFVHLGLPRNFLEACLHSQFLNIPSDLHGVSIGMGPGTKLLFNPTLGQHYLTATECRISPSQAGTELHGNSGPGDICTIVPPHCLHPHPPGCVCCF